MWCLCCIPILCPDGEAVLGDNNSAMHLFVEMAEKKNRERNDGFLKRLIK